MVGGEFDLKRPGAFEADVEFYTKGAGLRGRGVRTAVKQSMAHYRALKADLAKELGKAKKGLLSWFRQRPIIKKLQLEIARVELVLLGWGKITLAKFGYLGGVNGEGVVSSR